MAALTRLLLAGLLASVVHAGPGAGHAGGVGLMARLGLQLRPQPPHGAVADAEQGGEALWEDQVGGNGIASARATALGVDGDECTCGHSTSVWENARGPAASLAMVCFPKEVRTHCRKCNMHMPHKVSQYKKGKDSLVAQGKRRYDRKQKGFGGQTKPIFHKKAKTTKKVVVMLQCQECSRKLQRCIGRCKAFVSRPRILVLPALYAHDPVICTRVLLLCRESVSLSLCHALPLCARPRHSSACLSVVVEFLLTWLPGNWHCSFMPESGGESVVRETRYPRARLWRVAAPVLHGLCRPRTCDRYRDSSQAGPEVCALGFSRG